MDRVATRTDPVNATESFQYDGLGNLTRQTDRKGQVAAFTYDTLNRRSRATYADSTTNFIFDAVGRLIQATDSPGGTIERTYDLLDRVTAEATALGSVGYQYDPAGRRTAMTAPGQPSTTYTYDSASRLTQIVQGGQAITFQYDSASRRIRLTLPNQLSTDYQYDAASRPTALIYRNATGQLGDLTYQYDTGGNRVGVGGSFARTGLPNPVASASYDAANRQLTFGGRVLSYDPNGNLTNDGTTIYTWDSRDQLASLSTSSMSAGFQYDPLGRRARKTIDGNATAFAYDALNVLQELSGTNESR